MLELLKFNLQEANYPYFNDTELALLLQKNDNNLNKASIEGCKLKAVADDNVNVGVITTSSNREYWLSLAEHFEKLYNIEIEKLKELEAKTNRPRYSNSMRRVDER